jgi:aryl-alcohol dehydrogenase-like predicted oxidoreductase
VIGKRKLGQTDIEISPIGQGVMQFAGGQGVIRFLYPDLTPAEMNGIVKTALDQGINWFDTAEWYGRGRSEQGLARGLKAAGVRNGEAIVATKWWPLFRTASNMRRTVEDRLCYLEGFGVDLYQIHWPWSFSSPETEMQVMADLVDAGKIRAVGVSNYSAERMRRAYTALANRGVPLASNQVHYSLLDRGIEHNGILDTASELGMTIICWSPLNSGLLSGKYHKNPDLLDRTRPGQQMRLRRQIAKTGPLIEVLDDIAMARGATVARVALNWLITSPGGRRCDSVVAIPGATNTRQVEENAGAMAFTLSDNEIQRIDQASRDCQ